MSSIHMRCTFEVNGEDHVEGTLSFLFDRDKGVALIFDVDKLPRESIELHIGPSECIDVGNFFVKEDVYFWKIVVLEPDPPYQDVISIVSFSKDDSGVTVHLSLDFESEKMHVETPIDEETLADMPRVWGVDSK